MSYFELTDHFEVGAPIEDTWRFFSTADNLPKITPAWLKFTTVMDRPITIDRDTVLDYTIRWMGFPIKWRTLILDWEPRRRFTDLQIRGPYAMWHHTHEFEPKSKGGTICRDRVIYRIPFGPIGTLVHAIAIKRQLREIFLHRRRVIGEHLGGIVPVQSDVVIRSL